jgi:ribosome modulation factor
MLFDDATSVDDAFSEGFAAGRGGQSFRACPYPYHSEYRTAWLDGYRLAINPKIPTANRIDFRSAVGS